jgi:putative salt-induced outer membrane protein YdiY
VTLDSSLVVYPSITDSPRYRVSANVDLTTKISSRFAIKLSGYLNYDSRPPDPTATSTDYGIVTSLAYQFGVIVQ